MARSAVAGLVLIFIAIAAASFAHIYKEWVVLSAAGIKLYYGLWEKTLDTGTKVYDNTSWTEEDPVILKALAIAGTAFLVLALIFLNIHLCKKNRCCGIAAAILSLLGGMFLCGCAGFFLGKFWDNRDDMRLGFYVMCGAGGFGLLASIFLIVNACKSDNKIRRSDTMMTSYHNERGDQKPQKTGTRRNNVDLTPRNIKLDLSTRKGAAGTKNKRR